MSVENTPVDAGVHPIQAAQSAYESGTIKVTSGRFKVPAEYREGEKAGNEILGLDPIVAVIFAGALSFICFIAYLISQTPVVTK